MRRIGSSFLWGLALVALGALFLLQNLGLIGPIAGIVWAAVLVVAGAGFLWVFLRDRGRWWALIPALALLAVGALAVLGSLGLRAEWGGALFLGGLGLAFWLIYFTHHEHWWAAIPGGVLFTLAAIAGLSDRRLGFDTGAIFFLGLGLTFGVLYLLPTPHGRMTWAIFPAVPLILAGLVVFAGASGLLGYLWPAALILGGLYLLARAARPRSG